jgi:ferredoxin-like protein FixX
MTSIRVHPTILTSLYAISMVEIRAAAKCTEVTSQCPVEGTIYGYAPNLVFSIEFCLIFGICSLSQLGQKIRWRLWSFSIAVILGCLTEVIGK